MKRHLIIGSLVLLDSMIVMFVPILSLLVRFEGSVEEHYIGLLLDMLPMLLAVRLLCFYGFGLYHRLWRYASINELIAIIGSVTLSTVILAAYTSWVNLIFPKSIHLISWVLTIALVGAGRLCIRIIRQFRYRTNQACSRVLIVGAGDAGAMIAREIKHRYYDSKKIIGFIDDDSYKQQQMIYGSKVLGKREDIKRVAEENEVAEIIIAMPSVGGQVIREIVGVCKQIGCTVRILPGMYELIDGKVTVRQLREIALEDLLRREPVKLNIDDIADYIRDKRVLVTGAGGSIGSELCRQIASLLPSMLILLGKGENSIYEIDCELRQKYPELVFQPVIADIRDKERIDQIFSKYKPEVVFHAAAHKHVPLMETQPIEAVRNNIFGTKIVAEAADQAGTEIFVMISTDKAVNPTSVMGATKRIAELIIQHINQNSATKFVAVRFGNVLGSRGSVVPLFKKQIAQGGPITITHPDMKRYFMTIPEASQLVLQAGAMAAGGEVFVLDMGEPVRMVDMAKDLIELSGLVPQVDIEFKYTGMRPGEKLFEELLTAEEGTNATKHEKIYVANIRAVDERQLKQSLAALRKAIFDIEVIDALKQLVPTYTTERLYSRKVISKQNYGSEVQFNEHTGSYQPAAGVLR